MLPKSLHPDTKTEVEAVDPDKGTLAALESVPEIDEKLMPIGDGESGVWESWLDWMVKRIPKQTLKEIENYRPRWLWGIAITDVCIPFTLIAAAGKLGQFGIRLHYSSDDKAMEWFIYFQFVISYMIQMILGGMLITDLRSRDRDDIANLAHCLRGYNRCSAFIISYYVFIICCVYSMDAKNGKLASENAVCVLAHLMIVFMRFPILLCVGELIFKILAKLQEMSQVQNQDEKMCRRCEKKKCKITINRGADAVADVKEK